MISIQGLTFISDSNFFLLGLKNNFINLIKINAKIIRLGWLDRLLLLTGLFFALNLDLIFIFVLPIELFIIVIILVELEQLLDGCTLTYWARQVGKAIT